MTALKDQLVAANHAQTPAIQKRYSDVIARSLLIYFLPFLSINWTV